VANNQVYLKLVVEHLHKCKTVHNATVHIREVFRGQAVRQGDVEVFGLTGQPAVSPVTVVRASIVADAKGKK
jgi:hypothetical protein